MGPICNLNFQILNLISFIVVSNRNYRICRRSFEFEHLKFLLVTKRDNSKFVNNINLIESQYYSCFEKIQNFGLSHFVYTSSGMNKIGYYTFSTLSYLLQSA